MPLSWGSGPRLIRGFAGALAHLSQHPNGISISSTVFVGHNRQTHTTEFLGRIACMQCRDVACCYRCSVVCARLRFVSVGDNRELCKNGRTDRGGAVWGMNSGGPIEPYIRWESESPRGRGSYAGHLLAHCKTYGISSVSESYSVGGSSDAACRCSTAATCFTFKIYQKKKKTECVGSLLFSASSAVPSFSPASPHVP